MISIVYRTADGQEFADKESAEMHEVELELRDRFEGAASHRKMYVNTFLQFIVNEQEIIECYYLLLNSNERV